MTKVKIGDIVLCCIRGETFIATEDIVDEIESGDPDWVKVCDKKDQKYEAMKIQTINYALER